MSYRIRVVEPDLGTYSDAIVGPGPAPYEIARAALGETESRNDD